MRQTSVFYAPIKPRLLTNPPMTKQKTVTVLCLVLACVFSLSVTAQTMTHRYTFVFSNGIDSVGTANLTPSSAGIGTEAPLFTSSVLPALYPTKSMQVGMNYGAASSGLQGSPAILNAQVGAISLWLYPSAPQGSDVYVLAFIGVSATNDLLLHFAGPNRLEGKLSGQWLAYTNQAAIVSNWLHVVIQWTNSAGQFYVNGSLVGNFPSASYPAATTFRVGNYDPNNRANAANQFQGFIYDLRVYSNTLTPAQVTALYDTAGVQPAILAHRYTFASSNAFDLVASENFAVSGTTASTQPPNYPANAPSGSAQSLSMQVGMGYGTNASGLAHDSRSILNHAAGAVSLWFQESASQAGGRYLLADTGGGNDINLLFDGTDQLLAYVSGQRVASCALTVSNWYHAVLQWDDATKKAQFYLNGSQVGADALFTSSPNATVTRVGSYDPVGGGQLPGQFQGFVHDIQVYSGTLSSNQILVLAMNPGVRLPSAIAPAFFVSGGRSLVASAVATRSPYNADSTGSQDATAAIQSALDTVAASGGGMVFLPNGKYRVNGNLTIGYRTVLTGETVSLDCSAIGQGTVLMAYGGAGNTNSPPLIQDTTDSYAGIANLTIYYPNQNPLSIQPYPTTIVCCNGGMSVRNLILCNSYQGIQLNIGNCCMLENICGTVLSRGILVPASTEFSWMHHVSFSNAYWAAAAVALGGQALSSSQLQALDYYTQTHLLGLEVQRIDGMAIHHYHAPDAQTAIVLRKNPAYPDPVFGFGGIVADFQGTRQENDWAPWYYYMHYANLDKVPEANGKDYIFATEPLPATTNAFDVTAAPYFAAGDGASDDTSALQAALHDAGQRGGGTVFLRPGEYRVTQPLTVPSGVELRGPQGPWGREPRQTCALALYNLKDTSSPETDPAGITLMTNSGIRGFSIVYPEQNYSVTPPHAFPYTIRGQGSNVWVMDMVLVNSYNGIDFSANRCDRHLVHGLWGTAFNKSITVGGGSVGGKLELVAFDYGVWTGAFSRLGPLISSTRTTAVANYIYSNAVFYTFGNCAGETAWGLDGYMPYIHYRFVQDSGGSCTNADLWFSFHDVALLANTLCESGTNINLIGYFGTGWAYFGTNNWLQISDSFQGPVNIYAKMILQNFMVRPMTNSQVHFYDETSLTTGQPVSGTTPTLGALANVVDRNPLTLWQAPTGSFLTVDLGSNCLINRVAIENAGYLFTNSLNTRAALLLTSTNGTDFVTNATLGRTDGTNGFTFSDVPVTPTYARYVKLLVTSPGADNTIRVTSFNVNGLNSSELPTMRIDAPLFVTSNHLQMNLLGNAGRPTRFQASPDLRQWIALTNFISTNWLTVFTDTKPTNAATRFYRMVSP